jgi:hypothetical protein
MTTRFRPVRNDINKRVNSVGRNLSFPSSDATHGMLLIFRDYRYTPGNDRGFSQTGDQRITDTIFLPLPTNIVDNYEVRIERFDQGMYGDAVSQAGNFALGDGTELTTQNILSNMGLPATDTVSRILGGAIGAKLGFLATRSGAGAIVGALAGDSLNSGNVAASLEAGAGLRVNPKATLQFLGMEMKMHNFNWVLAPRSTEESDVIRNIGNTIKKNILPSYADLGNVLQRAMFKYPSFVDCFFVGLDPEYYYFFKTAMVRSFTIDYAPNGVSVLRGGKPAAVTMNMSIIESDIHTSEDYGGESGNVSNSNAAQLGSLFGQNPTLVNSLNSVRRSIGFGD